MIQSPAPHVKPLAPVAYRALGGAVTDQLEEAVLKLMNLARAALDQGDIDMASRLLRLAALASEDRVVLQQLTDLPDTLLAGMVPGEPDAMPN